MTLPNGKPLPVVLLANKCDLPDSVVSKEILDAFCIENNFVAWFPTSAKTNHNIEESVRGLVSAVLSHPGLFGFPPRMRALPFNPGISSSAFARLRTFNECGYVPPFFLWCRNLCTPTPFSTPLADAFEAQRLSSSKSAAPGAVAVAAPVDAAASKTGAAAGGAGGGGCC